MTREDVGRATVMIATPGGDWRMVGVADGFVGPSAPGVGDYPDGGPFEVSPGWPYFTPEEAAILLYGDGSARPLGLLGMGRPARVEPTESDSRQRRRWLARKGRR